MATRKYKVMLTGVLPLLMHADSVEWADKMEAWKNDPKNKKMSKAGDDRTPPERWIGYIYHDGNLVALPWDNIMTCLRQAATTVPTGQGKKTFKTQSVAGILSNETFWPIYVGGKTISVEDIRTAAAETDFSKHMQYAEALGFRLDVRRARVGESKHIRVRPRFDNWTANGSILVKDDAIKPQVLQNIFEIAGTEKGLMDWRLGGKTPGPFGTFSATIS